VQRALTEDNLRSFANSNVRAFYRIAEEAYVAMDDDLRSSRRPKPNNEPGWIITYDPDQKSFKNAFIAIVFCGVFLESLLHLLIVEHKGVAVFKKYDRKPYKDKLQLLGCNDISILQASVQYQNTRRQVVHEKAHLDIDDYRFAQKEAASAMEFVKKVIAYFDLKMG
jgi:hypothetical protein